MARDLETEIGEKRTLVFYKGRVSDDNKNKTGWIIHEYELTATLPNQVCSFYTCCLITTCYNCILNIFDGIDCITHFAFLV